MGGGGPASDRPLTPRSLGTSLPLEVDIKYQGTFFPSPKYNPYYPEYNSRVHGPYDPSRYYGLKPKMSLWDVKLGNLWNFIENDMEKTPRGIAACMGRFYNRWVARHHRVERVGLAPYFQLIAIITMSVYFSQLGIWGNGGHLAERRYKYHW